MFFKVTNRLYVFKIEKKHTEKQPTYHQWDPLCCPTFKKKGYNICLKSVSTLRPWGYLWLSIGTWDSLFLKWAKLKNSPQTCVWSELAVGEILTLNCNDSYALEDGSTSYITTCAAYSSGFLRRPQNLIKSAFDVY